MADRKIMRRGDAVIYVVPEQVEHYVAKGFAEDVPKRAPRKTRAKAGEK